MRTYMPQMVADMSHAFPMSSRARCGRVRLDAGDCGEVSATDQGLAA